MANFAKHIALTSGAAIIAMASSLGATNAATIKIDAAFNWATESSTPPVSPFTLMTLPGSGTNQLITSSGFDVGRHHRKFW